MSVVTKDGVADMAYSWNNPFLLRGLLCLQRCPNGRCIRPVRAAMEGICKIRLEISYIGPLYLVYGDCHCSMCAPNKLSVGRKANSFTQVCWGPLSFVTAYFITVQHRYRFPIQAIVSLGQIYGLILYYATSMFDLYHKDITYCRPEAYYFWFYFFFMNFIWMVIPGCEYCT